MSANSPSPAPGAPAASPTAAAARPRVTAYHWLVVILAIAGWLFDCMGQRIFVLGREPALRELLGPLASDSDVKYWGGIATFVLMIGWATGGIFFGMMSDRYGRVKVMVLALLAYTVFSGLSGFSSNVGWFMAWRFLFGLGVGGMFGAATTLVAESVPAHFRTLALGSMQALSAFGNISASALSLQIIPGEENFWGQYSGWQVLFFAGVAPAVLAIPMLLLLKEPELWKQAKARAAAGEQRPAGSVRELFAHPRWRRSTLVGVCLGLSGMVGLWGIAFFSPELITTALKTRPLLPDDIVRPAEFAAALKSPATPAAALVRSRLPEETRELLAQTDAAAFSPETRARLVAGLNEVLRDGLLYDAAAFENVVLKKNARNLLQLVQKGGEPQDLLFLNRQLLEHVFPGMMRELHRAIDANRSRGTLLQDVGALAGMFAFTFVAGYFSRRTAFLLSFALCLVVVPFVFSSLHTEQDVTWMLPLMGFSTLTVFAGYSIYFPEIFPTRLRGTGVGFCYNTVRFLAAPFPFLLGWLSTLMPFRTVATVMGLIYLVGLATLIWAPETKGRPLPDD